MVKVMLAMSKVHINGFSCSNIFFCKQLVISKCVNNLYLLRWAPRLRSMRIYESYAVIIIERVTK
jgi:hypothetical protein